MLDALGAYTVTSLRVPGHVIPNGHTGALYKNELYEVSIGRKGTTRLQSFGMVFGYHRVVIYIKPTPTGTDELLPNTARTQLILKGEGRRELGSAPFGGLSSARRESVFSDNL